MRCASGVPSRTLAASRIVSVRHQSAADRVIRTDGASLRKGLRLSFLKRRLCGHLPTNRVFFIIVFSQQWVQEELLLANTKSALKAIRVSERRRRRNQPIRSGVKTAIRRTRQLIAQGDLESANQAIIVAESTLDKAASKGVIHWRNAARRKSRLMRKLAQAAKASAS